MLDLQALSNKYLQIKLLDGTVLDLMQPNEELFIKLDAVQTGLNGKSTIAVVNTINDIAIEVLNQNKQGIKFTNLPSEYTVQLKSAIVAEYTKFVREGYSPN